MPRRRTARVTKDLVFLLQESGLSASAQLAYVRLTAVATEDGLLTLHPKNVMEAGGKDAVSELRDSGWLRILDGSAMYAVLAGQGAVPESVPEPVPEPVTSQEPEPKPVVAPDVVPEPEPEPVQQEIPLPTAERPDPLRDLPYLARMYCGLWDAISDVHHRIKAPKDRSKQWFAARSTMERLVRLDHYSEQDVVDVLLWVLTADHPDAEFWRAQVHGLANLRSIGKSGVSKFYQMHQRWENAGGRDMGHSETVNDLFPTNGMFVVKDDD